MDARVCISPRLRVRVTVGEFLGRVASRDQYRVRGNRVGTNCFGGSSVLCEGVG